MSEPRTISVVVPTYNRVDLAMRCALAVLDDPGTTELIIVDDGSADDTFMRMNRLALDHPRLRFVHQTNMGRSKARQAGLDAATSEIVLFLDDDVIVQPGCITGHSKAHSDDSTVVVGYMPVENTSSAISKLYSIEYEGAVAAYEDIDVLDKLWGGNVSLRRARALAAGLATDDEDSYHEDQEFGRRCQKLGMAGRFDKSLAAVHAHSRDLDGFLADAYKRGRALGGSVGFKGIFLASKDTAWLLRKVLTPLTNRNDDRAMFALKTLRRIATYQGQRSTKVII